MQPLLNQNYYHEFIWIHTILRTSKCLTYKNIISENWGSHLRVFLHPDGGCGPLQSNSLMETQPPSSTKLYDKQFFCCSSFLPSHLSLFLPSNWILAESNYYPFSRLHSPSRLLHSVCQKIWGMLAKLNLHLGGIPSASLLHYQARIIYYIKLYPNISNWLWGQDAPWLT